MSKFTEVMIKSSVDFTRTRLDILMKGREVGGNFPHPEAVGGLSFSYMATVYAIYIYFPRVGFNTHIDG